MEAPPVRPRKGKGILMADRVETSGDAAVGVTLEKDQHKR